MGCSRVFEREKAWMWDWEMDFLWMPLADCWEVTPKIFSPDMTFFCASKGLFPEGPSFFAVVT